MPIGRGKTCPRIGTPLAYACSVSRRTSGHECGAEWNWASVKLSGLPERSASSTSSRIRSGTASTEGNSWMTWSTPLPARATPDAIMCSSRSAASKLGVGSPSAVLWLTLREVEKPTAPASMASCARFRIRSMSASVAGSRAIPRLPIAKTRSGRVRQLGGDVGVEGPVAEKVEVIGEGAPGPGQPRGHDDLGNVLDALHQPDQVVS